MSQFGWGTLASIAAIIVGAYLQFAVTKRTTQSSDRHINFEEASEIIERLSTEITRKDLRITELERQVNEWQERCRTCEMKVRA